MLLYNVASTGCAKKERKSEKKERKKTGCMEAGHSSQPTNNQVDGARCDSSVGLTPDT